MKTVFFILQFMVIQQTGAQTCSSMWDPVFESNMANPPEMCPVSTTSGSTCVFPFRYNGITFKTCTVQGPSNGDMRPQCAISIDGNRTVTSWSNCVVPNDATIFSSTVRKNGAWTQNSGSTQGGTMLWIYGQRFASVGFNSIPSLANTNVVKLVNGYSVYDCEMHNDKCTETQLTCYTPALPEGVYQIRVYVRDQLIPLYQYYDSKRALFISSSGQTPTISTISPQSGTPQSIIQLTGSFKTSCYSRDVDGCAQDNNPLISRLFIGGHLCNMIDPSTGAVYINSSDTWLQCKFEGDEVGLFNVSMLVTNEYGRALVSSSLYRVSSTEDLYTFQSYAIINQVSPNNGSDVGGTVLTINGNYFVDSAKYPLIVKVGGQPCSILSINKTTIQCETSSKPSTNMTRYQGGRGLQMYRSSIFYNQANLSIINPPTPGSNATMTWANEVMYTSTLTGPETVWFIGYIRVPKSANFTFSIDTNGNAALFLSANDDPASKTMIVNSSNSVSAPIALQNDTNYYFFCVGSRSSGSLRLIPQARMLETSLVAGTSINVKNEIQAINIISTIVAEQQQINLSLNSTNGTGEVQVLQVDPSIFQIGFRGVYTAILNGQPTTAILQAALNDLPTIYPSRVTVDATSNLYYIRFPSEMGDVPLITCISSSNNQPNITELTAGISSGSKLAFELDGRLTEFMDFINTNITQTTLRTAINKLFSIRCPPSINDPRATPAITYIQDFETNCVYDDSPITSKAFCGQCSSNSNSLLSQNTAQGKILCFAYRTSDVYLVSITVGVQNPSDSSFYAWADLSFAPKLDSSWHYVCYDIRAILIAQARITSSVSSIVIQHAWLNNKVRNALLVDVISVRNELPVGYEDMSTDNSYDQSANNSCVFPFTYNNKIYTACTLNNNQLPICTDNRNNTYQCQSASIEGVRRLYPSHQILYNTLQVNYTTGSKNFTVAFRYSDCMSPPLFIPWPINGATATRLTAASTAANGTFDLAFDGQVYTSIPVDILPNDLANRLQGSPTVGFVNVKRTRDCTGYYYTIEWLTRGGAKKLFSITNASSVLPSSTQVIVDSVQVGGVIFKPITGDMTRTHNENPQVEVFVGGYSSRCIGLGACDFQWLTSQTPTVASVVQSGTTLMIIGTGFSTTASSNKVIIGKNGFCEVVASTATTINCTIAAAPAGTYSIRLIVDGKGLANGSSNYSATVALQATSISPTQGGAGGGYMITITGAGFSLLTSVTINDEPCDQIHIINFTTLHCAVPPSNVLTNTNVSVVVTSDSTTVTVPTQFTYDVANTPYITSFTPNFVTMSGNTLTINGTNFGINLPSITVGTIQATIRSASSTQILALLPALPPGIYPIRVNTVNGYARPAISIEYRFYLQKISPQVGSLYGGTGVYVQGYGFDSTTTVSFTDGSAEYPCSIVSYQADQIYCRTSSAAPTVVITPTGFDPTYGSGFAWSPQHATVQAGAVVQWQWGTSSTQLSNLAYKIQQVVDAQSSVPVLNGFDSGNSSSSGSFAYQFQNIGTYYYWSPSVDQGGSINMRGVINVVNASQRLLTVAVKSGSFRAQTCVFPFTYDSNNYTNCTTANDTQPWCSPTSNYQGQRLYCTPTATILNSSCQSSTVINSSACFSTNPNDDSQFLFTPCSVGSVTSISPIRGTAGTTINITGTGFSTISCENRVLIGSSYECQIENVTSNQIICTIQSNSTLSAATAQEVQVERVLQGFLSRNGLIRFQFQAKIMSITPTLGSTLGGTQVTISGDGFLPRETRVIIGNIDYTMNANISYNQIKLYTKVPPPQFIDQSIPITILIGNTPAICSLDACAFTWTRGFTPLVASVSPTTISGTQVITMSGGNFNPNGSVIASDARVTIGEEVCNVTSLTNTTIVCTINAVPLGNQTVKVSIEGVGIAVSSSQIMSLPIIFDVTPNSSGIYGGIIISIRGNGFPRSNNGVRVMIGNNSCSIINTTPDRIRCRVPMSQSLNDSNVSITVAVNGTTFPNITNFIYDTTITPRVSSIDPISGSSGQNLTISGSNFVVNETTVTVGGINCPLVNITLTTITCTVASSSAGAQPVVVQVASAGLSNSNVRFQYNLQVTSVSPVEGSYGGGQSLTIVGDGFNTSDVIVTICEIMCRSISINSNTQLTCVTPSMNSSLISDRICNITVTVGSISYSTTYTYRANLTANLISISPLRGGTGGGTTLTINGTNFPTVMNSVSVTIANVPCTIQSLSSTTIICYTGPYTYTTIQAPVIVTIVNVGNSVGFASFQYIDLWSSPWTWGGAPPPEEGTVVYIDSGKTVYFDTVTPKLKALIVDNASIIFDDMQDVAMNAEYILVVNGGRFQVGTQSNPFRHRAVITMYGHLRSIELPIFGAKVLALRQGTVDMHGAPVIRTWTKLASTANASSTQITLLENVNWPVGSLIIIATTGDHLSQGESEQRYITAISSDGKTLTLNTPLRYTHLGVTKTVGTVSIDVRAEVGLLSHNVVFQGSTDSSWNQTIEACPSGFNPGEFAVQTCFLGRYGQEMGSDQFGATIMASGNMVSSNSMQDVVLRLSNIEAFNVGQAFRLGRYPIHFHMNGNMNQSYIRSSSIHLSFNRAVNIHATHFVTIENNVIYNIMGGAMFLEDGIEVGNVFRGNLAVFVRTSSSLLNEDVTPAAFWVTSPNNIIEHNAVAGGTHFGYWYRLLRTPDGPSFALFPNGCPYRQPIGRFYNNSVHSVGRFGVWIFPEYSPTISGSCGALNPSQAVFDTLVTWKNNRGFEWVMSSTIQVRNVLAFDNADTGIRCVTAINHQDLNVASVRSTFYNENNGSSVINSIIIGDSGVSGAPIIPGEGGLVIMWDRGLRVRNVKFINFQNNSTQAIFGPIITGRCMIGCGGWLTSFAELSFENVLNRGRFRWVYDGLYLDEDGSLANTSGAIILPPDGLSRRYNVCTPTPNFENAITCPSSLGSWIRFAFNGASLGQNGDPIEIYDEFNSTTQVPFLKKRLTHTLGYMMNLLARRMYLIKFVNANASANLSYSGAFYSVPPGDYLIIQHPISYKPDRVYTTSSSSLAVNSLSPLTASSDNGNWYYDNNTSLFSFIIKNPSTNRLAIDISVPLRVIKCRYPNCEAPPQPGLELPATSRPSTALFWSNDSHWSFAVTNPNTNVSRKPENYTNVFIPRGVWLVVDFPLPSIRALRIEGVLEFQQGMNNTLRADSIFINGGQMIVGWPNNPLTSYVDIIITGSSSTEILLPNGAGSMGSRVIGVFGGLDIHGIRRNVTWTRLASTATAAQNTLILSEPVDWVTGDEIIVTTTDTYMDHTERHTISSINLARTTLTLTRNLSYSHLVTTRSFPNGQAFNIAAAVGLLTRNVRVINQSPASELFGFRILVTDYSTNVWSPAGAEFLNTYYKGYARLSNVQFNGFGQYVDAPNEDKREGIHLYNLGNWNSSRPTYIDSCSFDGGYFSAIGIWNTNGVPVKNNIVYKTFESGIVVAGANNIVEKNLVTSVYWSGEAKPEFYLFNRNHDAAIMSKHAISVVMKNNLVAGVQRLAYRVQGTACPGTTLPSGITNEYDNNEAHSALAGVNLWPEDKGFDFDQNCVLIKGFKTYKAWHYGLYINNRRNIIIDSCTVSDSFVGIFPFVIGPSPLSHTPAGNTILIRNSLVIGAGINDDCSDIRNKTTLSELAATKAVPKVADIGSDSDPVGRVGISFPYFSGDNLMPGHPWTGIAGYPTIEGLMTIRNVTFGYFNDVCSRKDVAIRVSQQNDDGQHPVVTDTIYVYNTSRTNLIFNGRPNLNVVNPSDCVDMDCDGLKKALLTDTDGTMFGEPGSIFSQAEYLWGNQAHGVGDYRIPSVIFANGTGQRININLTYPYRGIPRTESCIYQPSWQMYYCPNSTDYRMLIIESMDKDTETRRLSPVAMLSNGYIDLINGPQDHGWCNGYTCQKRISTFMAISRNRQNHNIYLSSTTPNHMRFRLLNADNSISVIFGLYYTTLQQVDVYANGVYIPPVNRDPSYTQYLVLTDQPGNMSLASPPGTNFFNRTSQLLSFVMRGDTVIDLKIGELIVLSFGLPATTPAAFFGPNILNNIGYLLGVSPDKFRRVNIVSGMNNTRIRRESSSIYLDVEIRDEPVQNLSAATSTAQSVRNLTAVIINSFQTGEMQQRWANSSFSNGTTLQELAIREPSNDTTVGLSVVSRLELIRLPSGCREMSPCDVQPVLVAYDPSNRVIDKLGSNDAPWQIEATIAGQANITLVGNIANYSNGQSQFKTFGISGLGTFGFRFRFLTPSGVSGSFTFNTSLTANTSSVSVSTAVLDAVQLDSLETVTANVPFNISVAIVDKVSREKMSHINWGNLTWSATVSLYNLPKHNGNGTLTMDNSSTVVVDVDNNKITATNLVIDTIGMYLLRVQISSSNNRYSISWKSTAVLVKSNSTTLKNLTGTPTTYVKFTGNYYSLESQGTLELTRAAIYNYFVTIGLPLSTNIVLSPGSVVASFDVDTSSTSAVSSAVDTLTTSGVNAIDGLSVDSVTIDSRTYSVDSSGSSSSSSSSGTNVGLAVGLSLGLTAAVVLGVVSVISYMKFKKVRGAQRLLNDPYAGGETNMKSQENIALKSSNNDAFKQNQSKTFSNNRVSPAPAEEVYETAHSPVSVSHIDQANAKSSKSNPNMANLELIQFN